MAYKKSLDLNNGYTAEYWRITSVPADKLAVDGEVVYLGYKDKATRDNGGNAIARKVFTIKVSDLDFSQDLFEQAYNLTKEMYESHDNFHQFGKFFADAESI